MADEQTDSKPWWKSKSIWFNGLVAVADVTGALVGVVPPGAATTTVSLINIALRALTKQPVHVVAPKTEP